MPRFVCAVNLLGWCSLLLLLMLCIASQPNPPSQHVSRRCCPIVGLLKIIGLGDGLH